MDAFDMLCEFGLTKQEARIYWTLFSEGALTGYEAAKSMGISRSTPTPPWPALWKRAPRT